MHKKGHRKSNKRIYLIVLLLFAVLMTGMFILQRSGESIYRTISVDINGTEAKEIQSVECFLFMGIDQDEESMTRDGYSDHGQCDALYLLVINRSEKTYAILPINRNTLMNVATIDENGEVLGTGELQVEFAHTTGDGKELSCENVVSSVSEFMYGHRIDGYMAFSLDSIKKVNHAAGGITVEIKDDFSGVDDSLVMGRSVTLTDDQAVTYLQGRKGVSEGTTENRMDRHVEYIEGIKDRLVASGDVDSEIATELLDVLVNDTCTDMSLNRLSRVIRAILEYEYTGTVEIEGTSSEDEWGFTAFTADKDSKAKAALKLLYKKQ